MVAKSQVEAARSHGACLNLDPCYLVMHRFSRQLACVVFLITCFLPLLAAGQTLNFSNDVQKFATLSNTTATLTGKAELHVTASGDPIPGCTIHLNSVDAWVFLDSVKPSTTSATLLSRFRVNGAAAVLDSNVRVVEHVNGTVVIPHSANFQPLQVFTRSHFTGASAKLSPYTAYNSIALGHFADNIRSFILKRGYTATFAQNSNGTGASRNYVAQDSDLEVRCAYRP